MTLGVDLTDFQSFASDRVRNAFRTARAKTPLLWQESDEGGFWAVLKHADIVAVSTNPLAYSSARKGVFLTDYPVSIDGSLLTTDPPEHRRLRGFVADYFSDSAVRGLEDWLRGEARRVMDRAVELKSLDFVMDMAAELPLQTINQIMGVPGVDRRRIQELVERMSRAGMVATPEAIAANQEMRDYGLELARERKKKGGDDLISTMLRIEHEDGPLNEVEFSGMFLQIAGAATDTTKGMLSAAVRHFANDKQTYAEIRQDPGLLRLAIEELLRFYPPVNYMRRTATRDIELRGQHIREGDKMMLYYLSANFDEDVFDDPFTLNIRRKRNPHLSFGVGEHICLGMRLARAELKIFLEEFIMRFADIELDGEPMMEHTLETSFFREMPVRLTVA